MSPQQQFNLFSTMEFDINYYRSKNKFSCLFLCGRRLIVAKCINLWLVSTKMLLFVCCLWVKTRYLCDLLLLFVGFFFFFALNYCDDRADDWPFCRTCRSFEWYRKVWLNFDSLKIFNVITELTSTFIRCGMVCDREFIFLFSQFVRMNEWESFALVWDTCGRGFLLFF